MLARVQRVSGFVLIMPFFFYFDDCVFKFCDHNYLIEACTPGPGHVEMMLRATDDLPLNFGFSGKGNTSDANSLNDVLRAGAAGFKLHEDWGTVCRISSSFLLQRNSIITHYHFLLHCHFVHRHLRRLMLV